MSWILSGNLKVTHGLALVHAHLMALKPIDYYLSTTQDIENDNLNQNPSLGPVFSKKITAHAIYTNIFK